MSVGYLDLEGSRHMEVLPVFLPGGVSNLCHPCMEYSDDHAKYSAAGLLVLTKKGE